MRDKIPVGKLLRELERWHNSGGKNRRNPWFVKRRMCFMCKMWPLSQSYLCHGCKDILLIKIAKELGVKIE